MVAAPSGTHDLASSMNSSPFRLIHPFGRTIQPLRSTRVTRLRRYYGLIRPWATPRYCRPRGSSPCGFPLSSWPPGSHVPRESPDRDHAAFMPVTTESVNRYRLGWVPGQRLEPGFGDVPTLSTPHQRFTCVRLLGPHLTGSSPAFSRNAHHRGFWPKQLQVVWDLVLQPDPEGPALISHAAWRSGSGPEPKPSCLRGAQSSA